MDAKQADRLAIARRATRALRHRDFRSTLAPGADESSNRVIIAALPDDRVGAILERVAEYRLPASVVLAAGERTLRIIVLTPCSTGSSSEQLEECPVHDDAEIGMLFDFMQAHRAPIHIQRATDFSMELVDDGTEVPTPV